ncbi:Integrator complex subunit 1 [Nymphon striatum]|nr:Integrator complex subunit 1 [Nymphon striatum]
MEKGKTGNRRGAQPKVRTLPPPGDFIALGSKSSGISSRTGTDSPLDPKLGGSSKGATSSLSLDRKRDSPTSSITASSKKLKFSGAGSSVPSIGRNLVDRKELAPAVITEPWEALAEPVEAAEFVNLVLKSDNEDKIDGLLCGAIKQLKNPKSKPESCLCFGLGLVYLSKVKPHCFNSKLVIEVYVDDSVGDRTWVDHPECKVFVDNLQTAFGTILPPLSFLLSDINSKPDSPSPTSSTGVVIEDYENSDSVHMLECHEIMDGIAIQQRFSLCKTKVENIALDVAKEQISRRQNPIDVPKNVIRFLASICGLIEARLLAVQRLESWFPHVKTSKTAEFLMMSVCLNCRMVSQQDIEVISCLTRIRFKSKSPLSHYLNCIKELLGAHTDNLHTVLKHVIYNELSNARNPNNMALLSMLAEVFQDLLANRDDYLRALRALLREIVRSLRHDMPFTVFCLGLMTERKEQLFKDLEPALKERMFLSLSDLITMTMLLAISPPVKEAAAAFMRGDRKAILINGVNKKEVVQTKRLTPNRRQKIRTRNKKKDWYGKKGLQQNGKAPHKQRYKAGDKDEVCEILYLPVLKTYQSNVAIMQRDSVWWMHTVVMNAYKVGKNEFNYCLRKILFVDPVDQYAIKDNWPAESERPMMIRLSSEVPILEDTLMRILIIGLSKDHPLVPQDALDYAEKLVCRAALSHVGGSIEPVLVVERLELIELLFNLSVYHYPDSIILPKGYQPPNLAISKSYWSVWIILLLTVAHNPEKFGSPAWQTYSTLQMLIEISITGHHKFPPPTLALGEKADDIRNKELQLAQLEKQEIIQFESHLAAASTNATITEETSLLLSQLTTLDPQGIAREPPSYIFEQLKELNSKLKLGHLLCRSREPDFLLDIIQRQVCIVKFDLYDLHK